jgi:hypothetical protein
MLGRGIDALSEVFEFDDGVKVGVSVNFGGTVDTISFRFVTECDDPRFGSLL